MAEDTYTLEAIRSEIVEAQRTLEENERFFLEKESSNDDDFDEPPMTRLHRLDREADDLLLAQDIAKNYVKQNLDDSERVQSLAQILCRHKKSLLHRKLYQDEFLPLVHYLRQHTTWMLRRKLMQSKYPESCEQMLEQYEGNSVDGDFFTIVRLCETAQQLITLQRQVTLQVEGSVSASGNDAIVVQELCRPFVQRVKHHFVEPTEDRKATSSRIDRLPEWLLNYLKEHVFQNGGAWELIFYGIADATTVGATASTSNSCRLLAIDFLNEILGMVQWVLGERNFFRDPLIAGPSSKPMLLCNAVEQLLQFDSFICSLLPETSRIISLVDACLVGDEELLLWWVARERESVLSALFDEDANLPLLNRVSHKAELFCALIRSVQKKAAVFSFSGPYLSQVGAPLCVQFLDAIHATAGDLRKKLTKRNLLPDEKLKENVEGWIQLINGANMAAAMLTGDTATLAGSHHTVSAAMTTMEEDLTRFGGSLERLKGIILDEFVTEIVEVLFMERTKLAGYLMRCSYVLSSTENEVEDELKLAEISPDLQETQRVLHFILTTLAKEPNLKKSNNEKGFGDFAPTVVNDLILSRLAERLLEVALDFQGMTPDLLQAGCTLFARDVDALFGKARLPKHALRVLDVANFMKMPSAQLGGIVGALCGLSGQPAPLTEGIFEADDRLFQEATNMVRAKGFGSIELADVVAVLNRRRDLM
jgi:hypothetical protein